MNTKFDLNSLYILSDYLILIYLEKHKTTTIAPKPEPTTTPTTNATTTVSPPTTTPPPTPPPTTTVSPPSTTPAPVAPPTKGKWAYVDKDTNVTCVIVQMAVQFNISYLDKRMFRFVYTISYVL